MADYSSHVDRDLFDQAIYDIVNDYLENNDSYPEEIVLAVRSETKELQLCTKEEVNEDWDTYPITSLIRDNEDGTKKEVDIDETYELASSYFFVR